MSKNKDAVLEALRKVNCAEAGGPGGAPPCRCTIFAGLLGSGGISLLEEVRVASIKEQRSPDPFPREAN